MKIDDFPIYCGWVIDAVGPAVAFHILLRKTGVWQVAFVWTIVVAPVAVVVLAGATGCVSALLRYVATGDGVGGDGPSLGSLIGLCAFYGVIFAAIGFACSMTAFAMWRGIHVCSFCCLKNRHCESTTPPGMTAMPDPAGLPIGAEQLLRYFEGVGRAYRGEHWRNGSEMCRRWSTLMASTPTQADIDSFIARLEAEPGSGSGWMDLGMQFRHWAVSQGFRA